MKTLQTIILLSAITATTGVQAAAVGSIDSYIDWSTLSITGATMAPVTYTLPTGESFSSDGEGWVGNDFVWNNLDTAYAVNGASAIASYSDTIFTLSGGYDGTLDRNISSVSVNNIGPGQQSGIAGGWHGMFYRATSSGEVTISVDYTGTASVSTDAVFPEFAYSTVGYSVFMDAVDADAWSAAYSAAKAGGASDADAEDAADLAVGVILDEYSLNVTDLIVCSGVCSDTDSLTGVLSVTFDVVNGANYTFGADIEGYVYTDVNAVPVPPAVWLFGSGLIGLIGIARRKKV